MEISLLLVHCALVPLHNEGNVAVGRCKIPDIFFLTHLDVIDTLLQSVDDSLSFDGQRKKTIEEI